MWTSLQRLGDAKAASDLPHGNAGMSSRPACINAPGATNVLPSWDQVVWDFQSGRRSAAMCYNPETLML